MLESMRRRSGLLAVMLASGALSGFMGFVAGLPYGDSIAGAIVGSAAGAVAGAWWVRRFIPVLRSGRLRHPASSGGTYGMWAGAVATLALHGSLAAINRRLDGNWLLTGLVVGGISGFILGEICSMVAGWFLKHDTEPIRRSGVLRSVGSTLSIVRMFARMAGRVPAAHLWYLLRRMRFEKPHRFAIGGRASRPPGSSVGHAGVTGSSPRLQTRINTFFPPYPSPAFDRFCAAVIARKRVPYSVYFAVTGACPFHCPHCSYAPRAAGFIPADLYAGDMRCAESVSEDHSREHAVGDKNRRDEPGGSLDEPGGAHDKLRGSRERCGSARRDMSREQMLGIIAQIKQLGTATIGFTGGEPLLRDDLEDLIAAAGPEMAAIVFTTGHGLDGSRAERLAEARTSCITIGIEAADAVAHDAVRGHAGSFAQAAEAARHCREAGLYLAISTIATRERIASGALEAMYGLGRAWGAGEFRILSPVATGAWRGCGSLMLSAEERARLIDFHVEHNRRPDGPAVNTFAYLESDALFGCGAGYHHLFVDAAGNVCPCDLTPLSFGNLADEPLTDIWQRMANHFPVPRRGCLMAGIAPQLTDEPSSLPLPPDRSACLCHPPAPDAALPEGYRRLLR